MSRGVNAPTKRIVILSTLLFFLFSILIVQYYKIQILEHEKWKGFADRQHYILLKEPFKRGRFFSNTSIPSKQGSEEIPLVYDVQKFHLYIDPLSIEEPFRASIINKIVQVVRASPKEQKKMKEQFLKKSRSRRLALWLSQEQHDQLSLWWNGFVKGKRIPKNALYFVADYKRCYPYGPLLGQVLHTVQEIKDEKTGGMIPTGGLELYFDKVLSGSYGLRKIMRSPRNQFDTGELVRTPEHGADIYLTINHVLQAIAETELEKGVLKHEAASGYAVVMDPATGEILALAQYPYFHPERYKEFFNDPVKIHHTRVGAITDAIEPGSVIKPLNLAIGLLGNTLAKTPLFDPEEIVATSNTKFAGRSKPLVDTTPRPFQNMNIAVKKSSNVYTARVVEKVVQTFGAPWYKERFCQYGFGKPTGVELLSETWGFVPTPGKKTRNGTQEWFLGTSHAMSMGYNIQVSYLQLARAYCTLANGGKLVTPTLVRKIVKGSEVLLDHTGPERVEKFPQILPPEVTKRMIRAMKYVTKPLGSASRGEVVGYSEAGKSGTAKKNFNGKYSDIHYRATFVGIAPANQPRLVIVVGMDEPKYGFVPNLGKNHNGGVCAAMVFSQIARQCLEYLEVTPDDPSSYPKTDPRYRPGKKDWMEENQLLLEMFKT